MTWRERIADARERGRFSLDDHEAWANPTTCFVGEQRARYTLRFNLEMTGIDGFTLGRLQPAIYEAVHKNDFDAAERLLDEVEDRALALKREYVEAGS